MLLSTVVSTIRGHLGNRYQLTIADVLRHVSSVQQAAFDRDLPAFLRVDQSVDRRPDASDPDLVSKGPYSFPSDVRRMEGVCLASCVESRNPDLDDFFPGRIDIIGKTWTFLDYPGLDEQYRWVYFRRPADLTSVDDDAKVLVPPEWHDRLLIGGALMLADRDLWGDRPQVEFEQTILAPFWADLAAQRSTPTPVRSEGNW